jgi:cytochrome c biogenesis protein CcmG/thiol:disulfide interchange protein DsbE
VAKSLRFLVPLALFVALAALLFFGLGTDPRKVPSPLVGKPVPQFSLPTLQDPKRTVSDADLRGQISLVNVWFSTCVSCRAEHRQLMAIAKESGAQIVGLNWKEENRADALRMLRQFGNPYHVVAYDEDGRVGIDWGVYGAPETFIVDRKGTIRYKQIGPIDQTVWEQTLKPIVEQLKAES